MQRVVAVEGNWTFDLRLRVFQPWSMWEGTTKLFWIGNLSQYRGSNLMCKHVLNSFYVWTFCLVEHRSMFGSNDESLLAVDLKLGCSLSDILLTEVHLTSDVNGARHLGRTWIFSWCGQTVRKLGLQSWLAHMANGVTCIFTGCRKELHGNKPFFLETCTP